MATFSLSNWLSRPIKYLIRLRWVIIGSAGVILFLIELNEQASLDAMHWGDVFTFGILLVSIGGLVELLLLNLNQKDHANMILEMKHKFSQNLALINDLVDLNTCVMDFLSSITQPLMSSVSINSPSPEILKTVTKWEPNEAGQKYQHLLDPHANCLPDKKDNLDVSNAVTTFQVEEDGSGLQEIYGYCLPLFYGTSMVGMFRFLLSPGESLKPSELEIVQSICTEIAISIKSIQQSHALSEASINQAILAERHEISRDLHDVLGHNIGYLRLKLDQFSQDDSQDQLLQSQAEMKQMHGVADESYELLRGVLMTLHPEDPVPIANLLLDQIRSKSQDDDFEYKFTTKGNPRPLTPHARRQIFFSYIEALRNASKYSHAQNLEINLFWGVDDVEIRIHDDGSGFEQIPGQTNQHFGLSIMQERIEDLGGNFSVTSATNEGTEVRFSIPLEGIQADPVNEEYKQDALLVNG